MRRQLGNVELAQAITNEHYPFNAVVILRFSRGPRPGDLRKALAYLQGRHPLLSMGIVREKKKWFFHSDSVPAIPLVELPRKDENHWQQIAEDELNTTLDFQTGPLLKVTYLVSPGKEGPGELLFNFHHAAVDGSSATRLLDECLSLCEKLERGESLDAPEMKELLPPAEAFFPRSYKGLRAKIKIMGFMLRQVGDEIAYRLATRKSRKAPIHLEGRGKITHFMLSGESTASLVKICRRWRMTLNNVLSTAIMQAVHQQLYENRPTLFRHFSFADLRPYLVPPVQEGYLGSYFSMMRFTVPMDSRESTGQAAGRFQKLTYGAQKKGDKFPAHLTSAGMLKALFRMRSFRMGTTALSYTGPVLLARSFGNIALDHLHVFTSNFVLGPEYTAQARLFDNRLYWDMLYLDSDMEQEKALKIAQNIQTQLEDFIKKGEE